ncbi:MAG: pantetheine-phosphate adenylyltransferase [Bacillota bacterium]
MLKAVYPGSFDPVTNGHLDIVARASKCFDQVCVVVFTNIEKNPFFTVEERVEMMRSVCRDYPNVVVQSASGLLVEYCKAMGIRVIVKGLRAVSDFDYEFKMALMNKKLSPDLETVFMITALKYLYLSSSLVKEVASYGGCIKGLVPPLVEERVLQRINDLKIAQSTKSGEKDEV